MGYPFQGDRAQFAHLTRLWNFRFARRRQNEFAPIEKADYQFVEGNYWRRLAGRPWKELVEIQRGSDFLQRIFKERRGRGPCVQTRGDSHCVRQRQPAR
jgi:hypothetical protein